MLAKAPDPVAAVLKDLEARSVAERMELEALNQRGAALVRQAAGRLMLDVGPAVGLLLNLVVRALRGQRIVEIGGSVGYSTIWLAEAARATGGTVFSIEFDQGKQREQRQNLEAAGLLGQVEQLFGDAAQLLPSLPGPFDLVLIDHWKDVYVREFDLVWPKMRSGGLVVADNILRPAATAELMRAYVAHVRASTQSRSMTLDVGQGIELTCHA
jgi:predicted O-methyltransferase YrrM